MADSVQGGATTTPSIATPALVCDTDTPVTTRRLFTSIASAPPPRRLVQAVLQAGASKPPGAVLMAIPGPLHRILSLRGSRAFRSLGQARAGARGSAQLS